MPGKEHDIITENAIKLLPDWQKKIIENETGKMVKEYCHYPDWYFWQCTEYHKAALPYHFETDGIQFHYIPDTPIIQHYRYYKISENGKKLELLPGEENKNWKHASAGFRYYIEKSISSFKEEKIKDACSFMGCLLHMLEDYGFGLHSMEGPYGTDLFVMDRLFPEADSFEKFPSNMLKATEFDKEMLRAYSPSLLGYKIDEMIFHLYTRYVQTTCSARRLSFQIVNNRYYFPEKDNKALFDRMYRNIISLCADLLFTVFCAASGRFEGMNEHLKEVFLSDMEPVSRPWGLSHYRFVTMLRDKAMNNEKKFVPLQTIVMNNGKTENITFEKGIGMGSHYNAELLYELPRNTYEELSFHIGFFHERISHGNLEIDFMNNGEKSYGITLSEEHPSEKITIHSPSGRCGLIIRNGKGMAGPHIVIGNPILKKH